MPRRTTSAPRPSLVGHLTERLLGRLRGNRVRRLTTWALAAAAPASCGWANAAAADDGVVSLSSGPGFGEEIPGWVEPAEAAVFGPGAGVLPAGYVSPTGPFARQAAAGGPMTAGPMGAGSGTAGSGVTLAQFAPPPAPTPFDAGTFVSPGAPTGFPQGGAPIDYLVQGGLPGAPGSLWTTIARYRPPQGSFVRVEYLRYSMSGEELGAVGELLPGVTAPTSGTTADLFTPFGNPAFNSRNSGDFSIPSIAPGESPRGANEIFVIPGLNSNEVNDFDGARVTFSRPVGLGRAEGWLTAFSQDTFSLQTGLPFTNATSVGIGVRTDADPEATNVILYNSAFEVEYETELWGGGGRYFFDYLAPDQGFGLRPHIGLRYMMFNQNLYQRGVDVRAATGTVAGEASTTVHNNLFGTELGVAAEYRSDRFTVGVRPSVSLGINQAQVRTRTFDLISDAEGEIRHTDYHTEFSPVLDLAAYLRVPLGENFRLSVGYDLLYLSNVAQPNASTTYDVTTAGLTTARPNFKPRRSFDDVTFNGLTIGLEMLIP